MQYKYKVLPEVDPNLLEKELETAGDAGYCLVNVQAIQKITPGMQLNGQPIIKLLYHLIFIKENNGSFRNSENN